MHPSWRHQGLGVIVLTLRTLELRRAAAQEAYEAAASEF